MLCWALQQRPRGVLSHHLRVLLLQSNTQPLCIIHLIHTNHTNITTITQQSFVTIRVNQDMIYRTNTLLSTTTRTYSQNLWTLSPRFQIHWSSSTIAPLLFMWLCYHHPTRINQQKKRGRINNKLEGTKLKGNDFFGQAGDPIKTFLRRESTKIFVCIFRVTEFWPKISHFLKIIPLRALFFPRFSTPFDFTNMIFFFKKKICLQCMFCYNKKITINEIKKVEIHTIIWIHTHDIYLTKLQF